LNRREYMAQVIGNDGLPNIESVYKFEGYLHSDSGSP
jgi:hypothetical protein